jgi:hypothetical protein
MGFAQDRREPLLVRQVFFSARSFFRCAHDNTSSFPRRALAPGLCIFASLTRIEGWAERRETFGCSAEHPLDMP